MSVRLDARVVARGREAGYTLLTIDVGPDFPPTIPGHFVMLRVPGRLDPLLPRPFSVYGRQGDRLDVLILKAGRGSRLLASLEPGDALDVIGPLGTTFPAPDDHPWLLVAGGVGVAPLRYALQAWPEVRPHAALVFGGRSREAVFLPPEAPARVQLTTDDGSAGLQGTVLAGVDAVLGADDPARWRVLTCGPDPMVRALVTTWGRRVASIHGSLEAHMACGMGACLGCVVPDGRGGYLRLCKEGPVLGTNQLLGMYDA